MEDQARLSPGAIPNLRLLLERVEANDGRLAAEVLMPLETE